MTDWYEWAEASEALLALKRSGQHLNLAGLPASNYQMLIGVHAMNVLFNSPLLYLIDYPGHDALEILNKRSGRMGLFRGATADRMRTEFENFFMEAHNQEEFEDFVETFDGVLDQPVTRH